jgi:hypothetical protein
MPGVHPVGTGSTPGVAIIIIIFSLIEDIPEGHPTGGHQGRHFRRTAEGRPVGHPGDTPGCPPEVSAGDFLGGMSSRVCSGASSREDILTILFIYLKLYSLVPF